MKDITETSTMRTLLHKKYMKGIDFSIINEMGCFEQMQVGKSNYKFMN